MLRSTIALLLGLVSALAGGAAAPASPETVAVPGKGKVVVIPIKHEIASPILYVLRRGLKEAERQGAGTVVLDIKTPGGALDVTFEMMEVLAKYSGTTIAYVNNEALSAGAFISASAQEIWFAPDGVIGAAAPVLATGADVDETMKQKIVSYLRARIRATSEGRAYRGEVISAMIDSNFELKIGDEVLKPKGELLSLTAKEASRTFGQPPVPLLAAGIATSVEDLLRQKFGAAGYETKTLEITWSERLAVVLTRLSPVLLGLGLLAFYIEFKTPGFGLFGTIGIALLGLVFLTSYVAGLSGHEPLLLFAAGVVLVALELVFWHTAGILGAVGVAAVLGSLLWAMADLWPNVPLTVAWNGDAFVQPLQNLGLGMIIALLLAVALLRFLPRGWVWNHLSIGGAIAGAAQVAGSDPAAAERIDSLVGRRGVAATALRPGGQVEIDGRRYEASVAVGAVHPGTAVVVRRRTDFGLIVEPDQGVRS